MSAHVLCEPTFDRDVTDLAIYGDEVWVVESGGFTQWRWSDEGMKAWVAIYHDGSQRAKRSE